VGKGRSQTEQQQERSKIALKEGESSKAAKMNQKKQGQAVSKTRREQKRRKEK